MPTNSVITIGEKPRIVTYALPVYPDATVYPDYWFDWATTSTGAMVVAETIAGNSFANNAPGAGSGNPTISSGTVNGQMKYFRNFWPHTPSLVSLGASSTTARNSTTPLLPPTLFEAIMSGSWAIAMWVKVRPDIADTSLGNAGDVITFSGFNATTGLNLSTDHFFKITVANSRGFCARFGTTSSDITGTGNPTKDAWYHIVANVSRQVSRATASVAFTLNGGVTYGGQIPNASTSGSYFSHVVFGNSSTPGTFSIRDVVIMTGSVDPAAAIAAYNAVDNSILSGIMLRFPMDEAPSSIDSRSKVPLVQLNSPGYTTMFSTPGVASFKNTNPDWRQIMTGTLVAARHQPFDDLFSTGSFTLEAWCSQSAHLSSTLRPLIGFRNSSGAANRFGLTYSMSSQVAGNSANCWTLYIGSGSVAAERIISVTGSNASIFPERNVWQHVAVTIDSTTLYPQCIWKFYVNGQLAATDWAYRSTQQALNSLTCSLTIGSNELGGQAGSFSAPTWFGKIGDIRIYRSIKTATEILADYNAQLSAHPNDA